MGQTLPRGFTPKAIELAFDRVLGSTGPALPGPTLRVGASPQLVRKLEAIVDRAVAELRKELGKAWLSNRVFGVRLHAKVQRLMEEASWPPGWMIFAEQPLREFARLPEDLNDLTVAEYLGRPVPAAVYKDQLLRILKSTGRIGDARPDLVILTPDGRMVVWDLTSTEREEHLAKTIFYTVLLTPDNHLTHIGETYWIPPERRGIPGP